MLRLASGGVMLVHKRKMGSLAVNVERSGERGVGGMCHSNGKMVCPP